MAALKQRQTTGLGQKVESALFENNVFLVAQHMLQYAVTGAPAAPMPERISSWAVYDVFSVKDGEQIFLAAVSDTQWDIFCKALDLDDLKADTRLPSNNHRVRERDWLIPELRSRLAHRSAAELAELFEREGLPYAPITRPEDLLDDPHLLATGALAPITLPDGERAGQTAPTVLFPFTLGGQRPGVRLSPPRLGEHNAELLLALGYDEAAIARLSVPGAQSA
jgi:crotonobetainyl-CoA:carnitine CoA-transferase CaiB-like acyl-CoA transferase